MNHYRTERLEYKLILAILLIDVFFVTLAIIFAFTSHSRYLQLSRVTAHNLVQLLEQRISDKARLIDDAVVRVERELSQQLLVGDIQTKRLEDILASEQRQLPEIDAIRITNAQGDVLWGKGVVPGVKVSYADRDFFKSHRRSSNSGLIITAPLLGKISGLWILSFTRAYHNAAGQFAGVVSAAVPVTTFGDLLATVNLGPTDTVVMRSRDMSLIARVPAVPGPAGQPGNKQASTELARVLAADLAVATYHTAQNPDSIERTYLFRRVHAWPFTIAVGLVDRDYLAPWRTEVLWLAILLGVFLLITSTFIWIGIRHLRVRSAMEKARSEDLARRRVLIEGSRDGIVVLDHQGKVWEANYRFAEMLGYSPAEVNQLHVWDWECVLTKEQLLLAISTIDATGDHFETRHKRKDGSIFDVEISTNGAVCIGQKLVFCVCRDVTERKMAEKTIRENEQLLLTLINSSPDIICFKDGQGRWLTANDAYLKLFSLVGVAYQGKTDAELAEDAAPIFRKVLLACAASDEKVWQAGTLSRSEDVVPGLTGTEKIFDILKAPLFEADDRRKGLVVLGRDISERIELEKTKANLQEQLVQAHKMEAIGTLAGGIAHDFNNILGAILGYAEMIFDDHPANSAAANHAQQIIASSIRAKELVKHILAFSRQTPVNTIPVLPATIVNEAAALLRASLPTTISINLDIDDNSGIILADPTQLHQIVMNLGTNAFHAMETSGGILTIALHRITLSPTDRWHNQHLAPGDYIELSIYDTGEGMRPEVLDKIFDPYFTTKEVGKGTGLGLAMVHGIVQNFSGTINCESQPGIGSTFRILLPVIVADANQEPKPLVTIPKGSEHILFIDDEEVLATMSKVMLERLGYRVTMATSSFDGLAAFSQQPAAFDLVITDQTMPGMTGTELSQRLLQIRPDLPIILCTGYSNLVSQAQARSIGIKGFTMKPMAKGDIAELIRTLLDEGKMVSTKV